MIKELSFNKFLDEFKALNHENRLKRPAPLQYDVCH